MAYQRRLTCGNAVFLLALVLWLPAAVSGARVMDAQAIPYTSFLSKADFDQRFPGEQVSDLAALEPGWYVIYEHESLAYYFGPVLLQSTGQDYLEELQDTVEAAVAQRPSIRDYRLELSYEPRETEGSRDRTPPEREAAPSSPSTSQKPSGIWGFIRSIFGF
ncbi:MAG: hypothetical protein ACLFU4_02615 [Opitutales bacterium]